MAAETHEFDVVLLGRYDVSDFTFLADALYEKGCDDSLVSMCGHTVRLAFWREAESLEQALESALANVRAAGCTPLKAEKAGVNRPVRLWTLHIEDAQQKLRELYVRASETDHRYWEADRDVKAQNGAASEDTLVKYIAAELDYEAAQAGFKQALHALLGLSEKEVQSVYNPEP